MVNPKTLALYTGHPVFIDPWGSFEVPAPHVRLTRWAELFVVIPATADIIGKAANGIADDLLSTAIVSSHLPVVFAPVMNPAMFNSASVRRNLARLAEDGHYVIPPEVGTSVTTGEFDTGLAPNVDAVMRSLWHVLMRRYKDEYWDAATSTKPATAVMGAAKPLPLVAPGTLETAGNQLTSSDA